MPKEKTQEYTDRELLVKLKRQLGKIKDNSFAVDCCNNWIKELEQKIEQEGREEGGKS